MAVMLFTLTSGGVYTKTLPHTCKPNQIHRKVDSYFNHMVDTCGRSTVIMVRTDMNGCVTNKLTLP
jgi:hypothetical protein